MLDVHKGIFDKSIPDLIKEKIKKGEEYGK